MPDVPQQLDEKQKKRLDADVRDVCPRDLIEADASSVCQKDLIDADVKNVCVGARIGADAALCRSKPPVIGIVPTLQPKEHILRVNDYYVNSIVLSGGVPLIFPITKDMRVLRRIFPIMDGFVLTGGQDVDPKRYGVMPQDSQYQHALDLTPTRDALEIKILEYAYAHDVPLLGICRGMQTMNVYFGGTLYLDLREQFEGRDHITGKAISHWQNTEPTQTTHYLRVARDSKLGAALGTNISAANSFHHQGVRKVAKNMRVVARSEDGLIEAIEAKDQTFMLGVQWHPEFFFDEKHTLNLFNTLIKEAHNARASGRLDSSL